jgi:hypothetical protein
MAAMRPLSLILVLAACGSHGGRQQPTGANPMPMDMGNFVDPLDYAVYANSDSSLYRVDPDTLQVTLVGAFGWPSGSDQMTDIAIDRSGNMLGISYDKVYSVDKSNAACAYLAPLDRQFNGLSFVPAQAGDPQGQEMLIASALDGSLYQIDPTSGASSLIGNYGGGMGSSGDVVSVAGFGTVATVTQPSDTSDWLARIDTISGKATPIGSTGVGSIWGLGFWKNQVFGFTVDNQFVLIDPKSGAGKIVQTGSVSFWGAGVTTLAPVVQ